MRSIGLKHTTGKLIYVTPATNVTALPDTLSYAETLFDATILQSFGVIALPDTLSYAETLYDVTILQSFGVIALPTEETFNVDVLTATAFQQKDVTSVMTTEVFTVDLFDVTATGQIVEAPNLVPVADVSVGDWTIAPLWSKINVPNSTTSFVSSSNANGSVCRIRFSVPTYNKTANLKFFRKKTTGNDPTFMWNLFRNGVSIQSNSLVLSNLTFEESIYLLNTDIISGATYELEMTRQGGGNPAQRGTLDIASVYIDPI